MNDVDVYRVYSRGKHVPQNDRKTKTDMKTKAKKKIYMCIGFDIDGGC